MSTGKTIAFHTLGCKLNFAETSTIARTFEENGYTKTNFDNGADVYIINTCSVTEDANRECRRIVRNALRNSPQAFVVVTGCYAQLKPEEIANIKGVDLVLGANEKFNALKFLNGGHKKERAEIHSCQIEEADFFTDAFSSGNRTRAFLKVQDGCDYNCSYCTIPLARGASRSDSIENVLRNAKKIIETDIKEIVLTGVNVGDFGSQPESEKSSETKDAFIDLIKELDELPKDFRIRISSIEPNLLTDNIIEFVSQSKKFTPHFHIPLQSGSDKILGLMRRRYKRGLYAERIKKIKSLMPHCCIGADVIVGFPGESDADFLETVHFIESLDVSYLHVFTYSERENTEAINFKPVIAMEERRKRNKILRNLSEMKQRNFYAKNSGSIRPVLWESENKNGFMQGFTDNYIKVKSKFNPALVNTITNTLIPHPNANNDIICSPEEDNALITHPAL